jgi:hypothetical protein
VVSEPVPGVALTEKGADMRCEALTIKGDRCSKSGVQMRSVPPARLRERATKRTLCTAHRKKLRQLGWALAPLKG